MLTVSGTDLVVAACRSGVVGAFPTANCRAGGELDEWLARIEAELETPAGEQAPAPFCPNLIVHRSNRRLERDLETLVRHRVELVITSVGSPAPVIDALRSTGCQVWSDVATLRHAERAIELGVDGLVLLAAGAGGQTGAANPFAFARAVRRRFDGTVILAGGISDGVALRAAHVLGCDLAYMGTRFIATRESMAPPAYKRMLVDCELDDVVLTSAFTGLPTNMLRPSIAAAGLDPDALGPAATFDMGHTLIGADGEPPTRWRDIWSAGHSVSGVDGILPVAELVAVIAGEYEAAARTPAARSAGALH
ncbi:NAD(P)H-dependent flavin oxidoreductase [Capillimicrobium parvum]